MSKQIFKDNPKKSTSPKFINREDYEWTKGESQKTFDKILINAAIVIGAISVYAIIAYPVVCFLGSKTKTE